MLPVEEAVEEPAPEPVSEPEPPVEEASPAPALGASALERLEARIRQAVAAVREARQGRAAAEAEAEKLRAQLDEQKQTITGLETQLASANSQLTAAQRDRQQIGDRIEALLGQVDDL